MPFVNNEGIYFFQGNNEKIRVFKKESYVICAIGKKTPMKLVEAKTTGNCQAAIVLLVEQT